MEETFLNHLKSYFLANTSPVSEYLQYFSSTQILAQCSGGGKKIHVRPKQGQT